MVRKAVSNNGFNCGYHTCLLTNPRNFSFYVFLDPIWATKMLSWNRLPDISPAKIGLFGISRELQSKVCSHVEPQPSSPPSKGRRGFYREENEVGRAIGKKKNVHRFFLAESLPGKKRVSPSCWALLLSQGVRMFLSGLPALFNLGFSLFIFYSTIAVWLLFCNFVPTSKWMPLHGKELLSGDCTHQACRQSFSLLVTLLNACYTKGSELEIKMRHLCP